jgi:hypothetical protein
MLSLSPFSASASPKTGGPRNQRPVPGSLQREGAGRANDSETAPQTTGILQNGLANGALSGSGPAGKKIKRPRLEHLVADRKIVVTARDFELLRPRQHGDELRGVARKHVALADRHQRRLRYARRLLRREAPAKAAGAGGERGAVALRLLREGAKQALRRVGEAIERRRLKGFGASGNPPSRTSLSPRPPKMSERTRLGRLSARKLAIRAPIE